MIRPLALSRMATLESPPVWDLHHSDNSERFPAAEHKIRDPKDVRFVTEFSQMDHLKVSRIFELHCPLAADKNDCKKMMRA